MAYYTGQCSSYQHLADILVEKCQAHGWAWQDGILSKDDLFVKIEVKEDYITSYQTDGIGIILTGGTGKNNTTLLNPSPVQSRLGSTARVSYRPFPAHYHLFIFDNEIYLMIKFDIDKFYYLAFGQSLLCKNTQSNGLWLSATSGRRMYGSSNKLENIEIYESSGGTYGSEVAPFWSASGASSNDYLHHSICHGLDGVLWSSLGKKSYSNFVPLLNRLPTTYFVDSPLLPYNIYLERPEKKISLIAQFINARFVRIDNYEPEQVITLGHDKWMIFPFFKKSVHQRSGGAYLTHTGTFGWAIRYEG